MAEATDPSTTILTRRRLSCTGPNKSGGIVPGDGSRAELGAAGYGSGVAFAAVVVAAAAVVVAAAAATALAAVASN